MRPSLSTSLCDLATAGAVHAGHDLAPTVGGMRSEREVIAASRAFTGESRMRSWWSLITTALILVGSLTIAGIAPWWPVQLAASLLGALVMVRAFIIYHDYMHGSILRGSWLARIICHIYGYLILAPPRHWRHSHNFHHAHVGKVIVVDSGSYPLMTTSMWQQASFAERVRYRISRSPLIILCAYPVVFAWSLTIEPMIDHPDRWVATIIALILHALLLGAIWWAGGPWVACVSFLLPMVIASMIGAYIFYVQHNVPDMRVLDDHTWTNHAASMETCSYLKLGRIFRWFSGNIGYHHIHHLNLAIPFYRLPEAMAAIPELQHPLTTTMAPRDIIACLRLKLWDATQGRMVGFPDA